MNKASTIHLFLFASIASLGNALYVDHGYYCYDGWNTENSIDTTPILTTNIEAQCNDDSYCRGYFYSDDSIYGFKIYTVTDWEDFGSQCDQFGGYKAKKREQPPAPEEDPISRTPCYDLDINWVDTEGSPCQWYKYGGNGDDNCNYFGDKYENFGYTANENCCACGGGSRSTGIDIVVDDIPVDDVVVTTCFSSENKATLANGITKRFDELQLGDQVLTGNGKFESIYSFGHNHRTQKAEFLQLLPSKIELSANHMVFLQDGRAIPAGIVEAGDVLHSGSIVTSIKKVMREGVYAPFTESGSIVANGELASSFVSLQPTSDTLLVGEKLSTGITHQWLAHTFELPHRAWCWSVGGCFKESYAADGISTWVSSPLKFFTWYLNESPITIRGILAIPILAAFGGLALMNYAINYSPALLQFVLLACIAWVSIGRSHIIGTSRKTVSKKL